MLQDQTRAPLFEALRSYGDRVKAPLHVPGHKMGNAAPPEWREFIGSPALSIDLTEAPGLDDLHAPEGVIAEAQVLAAEAFGAEHSFFLVGGTTAGIHALFLAASGPGRRVAVPRNAHRSVVGALILSGAMPQWIKVRFHDELDLAISNDMASLREALTNSSAALLINPTYHGMAKNLKAEIEEVRGNGIPVLVDEAHGSHFSFHPALPPSALALGADAVVQSTHKTGGSLTQSSLCHLSFNSRLSAVRVQEMLRLVQSTSPSYLLMASLDLARRELKLHGQDMWDRALALARELRQRLAGIPGIRVHDTDDPTKILVDVRGRGLTGGEAQEFLWSRGVAVEASGLAYVLAVVTPGDTPEMLGHFVQGLRDLPSSTGIIVFPPEPPWPEVVVSPREAYLGRKQAVNLREAAGRICSEIVAPYPPGIPVVAPGERLTADVIGYLQRAVALTYHLQGPADSTLTTIQVMEE